MTPGDQGTPAWVDEVAPGYLEPRYADYCFANVPATAAGALGIDVGRAVPADALIDPVGIERVLLVVVDGFGWTQWQRVAADHPVLSRLADRGAVVPLTSIYPTETAACMTTFHTGRHPVEHGLIGWDVYVESMETVIEPLPFRTAAGEPLERRPPGAADVELFFEGDPLYPDLRAAGVHPAVVQPVEIVGTAYTDRVLAETPVAGYESVQALATVVSDTLETDPTPRYLHVYYSAVDAAAHRDGTGSVAYHRAIASLDAMFDVLLRAVDPAVAAETLLLVTADHGEVDTDPRTNVDLYGIDGVRERLRRTSEGAIVPPVGGPRNVHLHVRPAASDVLRARLEAALDALVLDRTQYLDLGLFGPGEPSRLFDRRAGDLLVIPRTKSVWHADDPGALNFVGMHGGLHPDELLVPLGSARLSDLVD